MIWDSKQNTTAARINKINYSKKPKYSLNKIYVRKNKSMSLQRTVDEACNKIRQDVG